jgi:hypothetical protein
MSIGMEITNARTIAKDDKMVEIKGEIKAKAYDLEPPPSSVPDFQLMNRNFTKNKNYEIVVPEIEAYNKFKNVMNMDYTNRTTYSRVCS